MKKSSMFSVATNNVVDIAKGDPIYRHGLE